MLHAIGRLDGKVEGIVESIVVLSKRLDKAEESSAHRDADMAIDITKINKTLSEEIGEARVWRYMRHATTAALAAAVTFFGSLFISHH